MGGFKIRIMETQGNINDLEDTAIEITPSAVKCSTTELYPQKLPQLNNKEHSLRDMLYSHHQSPGRRKRRRGE